MPDLTNKNEYSPVLMKGIITGAPDDINRIVLSYLLDDKDNLNLRLLSKNNYTEFSALPQVKKALENFKKLGYLVDEEIILFPLLKEPEFRKIFLDVLSILNDDPIKLGDPNEFKQEKKGRYYALTKSKFFFCEKERESIFLEYIANKYIKTIGIYILEDDELSKKLSEKSYLKLCKRLKLATDFKRNPQYNTIQETLINQIIKKLENRINKDKYKVSFHPKKVVLEKLLASIKCANSQTIQELIETWESRTDFVEPNKENLKNNLEIIQAQRIKFPFSKNNEKTKTEALIYEIKDKFGYLKLKK